MLGFAVGTIGLDLQTGQPRFTFNLLPLLDGIDIVNVAVGLFGIGEVLWVASQLRGGGFQRVALMGPVMMTPSEWRRSLGKHFQDKRARFGDRQMTVFFAQRVMIKTRKYMFFFDAGTEAPVELQLRRDVHYPVATGNQQLGRHYNRSAIGNDPVGGSGQNEQDIGGDWSGNQRIGIVRSDTPGVVGEIARLDIGVDV
jgi:hypothetical protein